MLINAHNFIKEIKSINEIDSFNELNSYIEKNFQKDIIEFFIYEYWLDNLNEKIENIEKGKKFYTSYFKDINKMKNKRKIFQIYCTWGGIFDNTFNYEKNDFRLQCFNKGISLKNCLILTIILVKIKLKLKDYLKEFWEYFKLKFRKLFYFEYIKYKFILDSLFNTKYNIIIEKPRRKIGGKMKFMKLKKQEENFKIKSSFKNKAKNFEKTKNTIYKKENIKGKGIGFKKGFR